MAEAKVLPPMYGDIIGVDFDSDFLPDGDQRVVVYIAVPASSAIGKRRVVIMDAGPAAWTRSRLGEDAYCDLLDTIDPGAEQ